MSHQSDRLAIVVHPSTYSTNLFDKRAAPKPHPVIPIYSTSQCFKTMDACTNGTDTCSGHGECLSVTRGPKTCFACSCGVTKDSKGRKTTWAGQSCERIDYSS